MVDILPDDAPSPRLCHLIKWPDFDGYGFNLHAERSNPGQFIGKIDDDSPAKLAGLQEGDRIVEVNGVNISNENHRQVVERIKSEPNETRLLVVDPETDLWYKEQDLVVKSSQLNVIYIRTPVPRPEVQEAAAAAASAVAAEVAKTENGEEAKHGGQVEQSNLTKVEQHGDSTAPSQSVSPTAMGSSSLETSDFNDDSIEQAAQQQQQNLSQQSATTETTTKIKSHVSPPMSPDSGKGDEVELPTNGNQNMVTIEAEMNRQSKPQNDQNVDDDNTQEVVRVAQANMKQQEEEEEDSLHHHQQQQQNHSHKEEVGSIQPDSLNNQAQADDESEAFRKAETQSQPEQVVGRSLDKEDEQQQQQARNGSADSGQSSPQDASSSDGSIADSLEAEPQQSKIKTNINNNDNNNKVQQQQQTSEGLNKNGTSMLQRRDEEDALTIRNYLEAANNKLAINNNNNNNEPTKVHTTPIKSQATQKEAAVSGLETQQNLNATTASEQPLRSALAQGNLNGNSRAAPDEQQKLGEQLKQQQQPQNAQKNSGSGATNNNFSGLNLNMTASEMRELIARRKKFDPKKAQMNIRQKYEIIQQM